MTDLTRTLWTRYETIHDVVYFSPRVREQTAALGLKGFWMTYFAFRMAPLGALGPAVATAVCYGFHPRRVGRALPDAWRYTTPDRALAARDEAAVRALRDAGGTDGTDVAAAADLIWAASRAADTAGRPLAAANQALPRPGDPLLAVWLATTVLREHRGDGHNAVLVARGVRPAEAHLIKAAADEADGEILRTGRGFDEQEWAQARAGLVARGWLDEAGRLTDAGAAEHRAIEEATDRAAAEPWRVLGPDRAGETLRALEPLAAAVARSGQIPVPSPVGMIWNG